APDPRLGREAPEDHPRARHPGAGRGEPSHSHRPGQRHGRPRDPDLRPDAANRRRAGRSRPGPRHPAPAAAPTEVLMEPLENIRVLTLAVNLPGPLAVARLRQLGAAVVKVEPPEGDPLARVKPDWYRALHEGQEVFRLNLKDAEGRARLDTWL